MAVRNIKIAILISLSCFAFVINSFAQSQLELNSTAYNNFLKADKELNDVYSSIIKKYKPDTAFIKNLKKSQRVWIQFRDAEILMKYPNREPGYYGSSHSMCVYSYKEELTRERLKKLEMWLKGVEEGDLCSGSVITN